MGHKGWIALDIDGTITDHPSHVPKPVCDYLHSLVDKGWQIIFITGRPLSFGISALGVFDFPFFLAVQNGADLLYMPERRLLARHYLSGTIIQVLDKIYTEHSEDFIVYSGYERGDFCYYRPERFSAELKEHLKKIQTLSPEPWQALESFDPLIQEQFPLIKCLGSEALMEGICEQLKETQQIAVSLIRDPLGEEIYLNLITEARATKGAALMHMIDHFGKRGPIIVAGDDRNDISMLRCADIGIVMETAPQEMHEEGDIIAPPAQAMGIIEALEEAVRNA